jgi:hypothetical protein
MRLSTIALAFASLASSINAYWMGDIARMILHLDALLSSEQY